MTVKLTGLIESVWASQKFCRYFIITARLTKALIVENELIEERSARIKVRLSISKEVVISDEKLVLLLNPNIPISFTVETQFTADLDKDGNRIKCFKALDFDS